MQVKKNINKKVSLTAYLLVNDISISHYCYRNYLSINGNCRVCLIELKNSMKPIVSYITNANTALEKKRYYSTTRKLLVPGKFETYAIIKTVTWPFGDDKSNLIEIGNVLNGVTGVSSDIAYNILDECADDNRLCSFYLGELAKSPETRNLIKESFSKIKTEFKVDFTVDQEKGFKVKGSMSTTLEGNSRDLQELQQKSAQALQEAKSIYNKTTSEILPEFASKGKDAIIKGGMGAGLVVVPGVLFVANLSAGLNSVTYPQSVNNAIDNFSRIENFGSFDTDESPKDRIAKFKKRHSSKF